MNRLRRIGRSAEQAAEQKSEPQAADHTDAAQNGSNGVVGTDHIDQAEAHEHTNGVAEMEMDASAAQAAAAPHMEAAEEGVAAIPGDVLVPPDDLAASEGDVPV